MKVLQQWLALWKGLRLLAEVFWKWRCSRRTRSHRTALHLNRMPPTLLSSVNMRPNHRYSPTLRKHTKVRTSLSLQHLLSPHQTPRSPFTLHRRRKPQSRTQNHTSTITGSSSWPTMHLRSKDDALLETLYRSPRMPTNILLCICHLCINVMRLFLRVAMASMVSFASMIVPFHAFW
jgi:hypothetical protein